MARQKSNQIDKVVWPQGDIKEEEAVTTRVEFLNPQHHLPIPYDNMMRYIHLKSSFLMWNIKFTKSATYYSEYPIENIGHLHYLHILP